MNDKLKTNVTASWSLVFAVSGFICLPIIGPVISLILAGKAKKQIAASGEQGLKLTEISVLLSWIAIGLFIIIIIIAVPVILYFVAAFSAASAAATIIDEE